MSEQWEEGCLLANPFEGDYGGSGSYDRILSDKIVTVRKGGKCHTCEGAIEPKTRVRRRVEVYDGELMRFGWCTACCVAMASNDFDVYEARVAIGNRVRDGEGAGNG